MLIAREFTKDDELILRQMIDEINLTDSNFEGLSNISNIENYDAFLVSLEKNKHQELIKPEYSPQTTFGIFDDDRLIGGFNLRHVIKGNLINHGGNIGYLIRPSERGKGYGTKMLHLALQKADELGLEKVLVSCRVENISSAKVIENNGGEYENNYFEEETGKTFKRYWIDVKSELLKNKSNGDRIVLETERLILRNFVESDLDDYWEYVQMESVGPRAGWKAYTDKEKAKERLLIESSKPNQFALVLKTENKVIGSVELRDCMLESYSNLIIEDGAKEIGAVLSEKYWGEGYMPEAIKEVMRYAFVDLKVPVIYCSHAEANINSARLQEKCGFRIIGKLTNYSKWVDGSVTSLIERKMTSEEYYELYIKNLKSR